MRNNDSRYSLPWREIGVILLLAVFAIGLGSIWFQRFSLRVIPTTSLWVAPAGSKDAFGHVWQQGAGSPRNGFVETYGLYRQREFPSASRGPLFRASTFWMEHCAVAGEVFTYSDLLRYYGQPESCIRRDGGETVYSYSYTQTSADYKAHFIFTKSGILRAIGWSMNPSTQHDTASK